MKMTIGLLLMIYILVAFSVLALVGIAVISGRSVRAFREGYSKPENYFTQRVY